MVEFKVNEVSVKAETKPDLFSPKGLDQGSKLLIECLTHFEFNTALDWGCGWGAIGLWIAVGFPSRTVVALDSDLGAFKTAKFNVELNQVKNMGVLISHGFEEVPSNFGFDLVCSNPPTHRGREVVEDMIKESQIWLNPNGHLLIVVENRLKPWVTRAMKETFGNCKVEKRGPKNVVLSSTKTV